MACDLPQLPRPPLSEFSESAPMLVLMDLNHLLTYSRLKALVTKETSDWAGSFSCIESLL